VNGEQIRNQLEALESQAIELAAGLIGTIAEVRARLVLLETANEMAQCYGDDGTERAASDRAKMWPTTIVAADLDRIRRLFGTEEA